MMCDPTASVVPTKAIARLTSWLAAGAATNAAKGIIANKPVLVGDSYIEAAALLGDGGRLAGIFCRGLSGHQPRKAVVFVNAGAIYHVGWARMHVEMARELARSGIPSLRFDLAVIGDSEASPHGTPHLYGALSHMRAAIDCCTRMVFVISPSAVRAAALIKRSMQRSRIAASRASHWSISFVLTGVRPTQCSSKRGGAPKRDRNRSSRRRARCGHRAAKRAWIVGAWSAAGEAAGEIRPPACDKSVRAGKHGVERQESGRALVRRLIETA